MLSLQASVGEAWCRDEEVAGTQMVAGACWASPDRRSVPRAAGCVASGRSPEEGQRRHACGGPTCLACGIRHWVDWRRLLRSMTSSLPTSAGDLLLSAGLRWGALLLVGQPSPSIAFPVLCLLAWHTGSRSGGGSRKSSGDRSKSSQQAQLGKCLRIVFRFVSAVEMGLTSRGLGSQRLNQPSSMVLARIPFP